jgi:hypothetical protein
MREFLIKRLRRAPVIGPLWDKFERALAARDIAIVERDAALAARDIAIAERDAALSARDAAPVERECRLNQRDRGEPLAITMPTYYMDTRATLVIERLKWRQRQLLSNYTRNIISMIHLEEKELLAFLAEEFYTGDGIIFDGGIFMGASTLCFCEGLKRRSIPYRSNALKPIQAFDLGICDAFMPAMINTVENSALKPGDSFIEYTKKNLSGREALIDLHVGNVMDTAKNFGCGIEILFYDCGKTPAVDEFMVKNMFTQLMPGRSILIHQDFFFEMTPWLHVSQGFLWNKFQYLGAFGNSAVFLCTDRISHAEVLQYSWDAISYEEASRLLQVCLDGTQDQDRGRRYLLELSQCMLAAYKGSPEDGAKRIQGITFPDQRQTTIGFELAAPYRVLEILRSMLPAGFNAELPAGFNPERYLKLNPDVAAAGADPASHWKEYGYWEGRRWE